MSSDAMTDSASMIADSAREFINGTGGVARARAVRDNWPNFDHAIWQQVAALGWPGITVPEARGGIGLDVRDMCVLLESAGRALFPEPLAPSIAAAGFLGECDGAVADELLAELIAGNKVWLMAAASASGSSSGSALPLALRHVADCYAGAGLLVAHGDGAAFQVRAVDTDAPGVNVQRAECVDGSVLADVMIDPSAWSRAALVAEGDHAQVVWDKAQDALLLAYSAYLAGLMHEALQLALGYMKIRSQFGTPIGTFQALQHRAASCHVDIVASRALVYEACNAFPTAMRRRAACAAKARTSAAALRVTKECVQFHGAIGFADEHDIGLYLRKAMTIAARQGGEMTQKLRYKDLADLAGA